MDMATAPDSLQLARAGLSWMRSAIDYSVHGTGRPFSASFAVLNACNIHCSYCNFPDLDKRTLKLPQITTVLDNLAKAGVVRLGLVGGEPLLRRDLPSIIQLARERRFFISINSNLLLHYRSPNILPQADLVFTSLDGPKQHHEKIRGPDSFDGVLDAIGDLRARNTAVVAICVLTEQNSEAITWLLQQAEKLGFRLHFQAQCLDSLLTRGEGAGMHTTTYRNIWHELIQLKRKGAPIASSYGYLQAVAAWPDFGRSAIMSPHFSRCGAGKAFMFVDAQGMAWPCAFTAGQAEALDLTSPEADVRFVQPTPCTDCVVGPMLEANLLVRQPFRAGLEAIRDYAVPILTKQL